MTNKSPECAEAFQLWPRGPRTHRPRALLFIGSLFLIDRLDPASDGEDALLIALLVFALAYVAIASEKLPRHWVALAGGGVLILFGVLSPSEAFFYINWETLGLLSGMFVLVSILNEAGFFAWLALTAVRQVNYRPAYLFIVLIILAAVLAMFMDSITVMLFLSALTLQLCRLLKLDPVPLIIAEVCAANTGGAATLVGDPPNVILGTELGFNFGDFAMNTGPISAIAALSLLVIFYLVNRTSLSAFTSVYQRLMIGMRGLAPISHYYPPRLSYSASNAAISPSPAFSAMPRGVSQSSIRVRR
jgi:Na+/H+ antiporter NhaD/arsenite permease-like protein